MKMKERQKNVKSTFIVIAVLFLWLFSMLGGGMTNARVQAEESSPTVQKIVDSTVFVTFKKGENGARGKYIVSCFYVPKTVYEETYTYGVIIFPKDYGMRFDLTSDYFNKAEEQGAAILNVEAIKKIDEENGYGFNCGISRILDGNLSRTLVFIFYVKDGDGNVAYCQPQFADYNSLIAGELTTEELIHITESKDAMQSSFISIVEKISELVNSILLYVVIALSSVVVVWSAYIGIRVITARKNDEKINARKMIKQLLIGILIMFVFATCIPLLINGLSSWLSW